MQQAILESWLDQGGHTLIIFSQNMVYDLYTGNWTSETNAFLTNYVGAIGSAADGDLNHATYTITGATGTALAGKVFQVIGDQPIGSSGDTINPATGTDVLGTVVSDADGVLTPAAADPHRCGAKGRRHRRDVEGRYVGAPAENILMTAANNSAASAVPRHPGLLGRQGLVAGLTRGTAPAARVLRHHSPRPSTVLVARRGAFHLGSTVPLNSPEGV